MAEADAGRGPDAAAVGAAMGEHVGHRLDPRRIDRLGDVGMEDAGDAAHQRSTGGAVRERGDRAERGEEIVDRRPRARLGRRLAETRTATARCGPPSRRTFNVSSFTFTPLPVTMSPTR